MSQFGTFLLGLNPWLTLITCIVPRVLCGWLSGLLFKALAKVDKTNLVSFFAASLSTALLNTLFFMGCIILFFWKNSSFTGKMVEWGMSVNTVWVFLLGFVGLNGLIEAIVAFITGAAIAKAIVKLTGRWEKA